MKTEEVTIQTLPVEIRVIRVGGHKMTLSVFDQIPEGYLLGSVSDQLFGDLVTEQGYFVDRLTDVIRSPNGCWGEVSVLGYIRRSGFYLLYSSDGQLFKENISSLASNIVSNFELRGIPHSSDWLESVLINQSEYSYSQLFIAT